MKKIVASIAVIALAVILSRLGWAYYQVKNDEAKNTNTSASAVATPGAVQAKSDVASNFLTCTYEKSLNDIYGYSGKYAVEYPDTWQNKSCGMFLSPDDRGRMQDFIIVDKFEMKGMRKENIDQIQNWMNAGGYVVDGLTAFKDTKYNSVRFVKDGWSFTLRKGEMTSDEIFDRFVKSFHFVNI